MSGSTSKYAVSRNCYGNLVAKTEITISEERRLLLVVSTSKNSSKILNTSASVSEVSEDGKSTMHKLFDDFSMTVFQTLPTRVTLKVVEAQHAGIDIASIVLQAKIHYKIAV